MDRLAASESFKEVGPYRGYDYEVANIILGLLLQNLRDIDFQLL
jgi:hypothetical protein